MEEDFTEEDLKYIQEPFNGRDLNYIDKNGVYYFK